MKNLDGYTDIGLEEDINYYVRAIKEKRGLDYTNLLTFKISEIIGDTVAEIRDGGGLVGVDIWIGTIYYAIYDCFDDLYVKGIHRVWDGEKQHDPEEIDAGIAQAVTAVLAASVLTRVDWDALSDADSLQDSDLVYEL